MTEPFRQPGPLAELKWAGIDLDGTLARPVWSPDNPTAEIGPPIEQNIRKVKALAAKGWKIVIHTSRAWTDYQAIEAWLNHHKIPFRSIICGKALFGLMIDDRNVDVDCPDWSDPRSLEESAFDAGFSEGYAQGIKDAEREVAS